MPANLSLLMQKDVNHLLSPESLPERKKKQKQNETKEKKLSLIAVDRRLRRTSGDRSVRGLADRRRPISRGSARSQRTRRRPQRPQNCEYAILLLPERMYACLRVERCPYVRISWREPVGWI